MPPHLPTTYLGIFLHMRWFSTNQHRTFAEKPGWQAGSCLGWGCPACPASFIICFQVCNAFVVKIQQPWLLSSLLTSSQLFLCLQPRIVAHQFPPHIPQPRKMSSCYSTASLIHDSHVVQVANITARYPIATLQSMGKEQCRLRHDHSGAL